MFEQPSISDQNVPKVFAPPARAIDTEIEAVDLTVLLSFEELQDDETDLVGELIDLYLQDAAVKIDTMLQAVAKADAKSLKHAAHSLKGSSGTLGVRQLALICEELECLANAGLTPAANAMMHQLEAEFARVQEVLMSELNRRRSPCQAGV